MESRTFTASFSDFDSMMSYIRDAIKGVSHLLNKGSQFEVAIEEALVNVIKYAYRPPEGIVKIEYGMSEGNKDFVVKIIDRGSPFNPLKSEGLISPVSLESQSLGGLGIHFIRKMSDSVDYEYIAECNVLTLTKKLTALGS